MTNWVIVHETLPFCESANFFLSQKVSRLIGRVLEVPNQN